jgi:hypothetical protein
MKVWKFILVLEMSKIGLNFAKIWLGIFLLGAVALRAGDLEKRSRFALTIGKWQQGKESRQVNQVGPYLIQTTAPKASTLGALSYAYWMRKNLSFNFTLALISFKARSQVEFAAASSSRFVGLSRHAVRVFPILFGIRYYLPLPVAGNILRPHLAVSTGPYFAVEGTHAIGGEVLQNSRTLIALGSHFGGGLDIQLSRRLMIGANVGYNFLTGYSRSLSGRDNYSGTEVSAGMSLLFGRGAP